MEISLNRFCIGMNFLFLDVHCTLYILKAVNNVWIKATAIILTVKLLLLLIKH